MWTELQTGVKRKESFGHADLLGSWSKRTEATQTIRLEHDSFTSATQTEVDG